MNNDNELNNISAEEDESNVQLYEKPVPENDFVQHCIQRRKYPVLLKVNTSIVHRFYLISDKMYLSQSNY